MAGMPNTDREGESRLLLTGASVVLPEETLEGVSVLVGGGRIERVSSGGAGSPGARAINLEGLTLMPGFVDVHIHGAVGVDASDAGAEDLRRVARFLASRGVTAWLPTLVPAPPADYRRAVEAVDELMRDPREGEARAVGLHYEGPFVNERQCGALRAQFFRTYARPSDVDELPTLRAPGAAHMMTLAPEVEGGVELIRELRRRGWVVSVGHTRADLEVLERARAAGARHMTHFLNAMSRLHHRAPGPIGWGLTTDDVTVDLIADGVHSDPLLLGIVLRCKTAARVSLISDAVAPAGLGDGEFRVWGETIRVAGGRTSNERGSIAGSVINMQDAVRLVSTLGVPAHELAQMASLNPARLVGLGHERGSIEAGKRADLVALDTEGRARFTLVGGRVAFSEISS
jgi:N-acetylglucosamine-6-phosphate deacetylase